MAEIDVEIDDISTAGEGIAAVRGRPLLVPFTIPGERVRIQLPANGRGGAVARLRAILRPSAHRITPRCSHFGPDAIPGAGPCGGCSWQHIAYAEQLRLKAHIVERAVRSGTRRAPHVLPTIAPTGSDEPWGYRQKVHFVFGPGNRRESLTMGHFVKGSRRIIPVDECPVHDTYGNGLAFRIRDRLLYYRVEADALSSVAIRVGHGTGELMATVVATHDRDKRLRTATRDIIAREPDVAFSLNLHPARNAFIFGRDTRHLHGAERLREEVAGTSYLIAPTAFFQTNVVAAELLVQLVLQSLPTPTHVLDLYAGAGLFALPLARSGHTVTAVEENRHAVEAGIASARLNGIDATRCRFVNRRVEVAIRSAQAADTVVLDPPREGCSPEVIDALFVRRRPSLAVYVSCNPDALGDDLAAIDRAGYTIRSIQPVDMFPHTAHIETVVVLTR